MKKASAVVLGTIIYAAAGAASAQSAVSVMGLVDAYTGSLQYSGDAAHPTVINSGGMSTSYFGFKGNEELGAGMKAEFVLTGFLQADTGASGRFGGDNLFSRDALVALSGNFGRITVGRTSAISFLPMIQFNPFGDSFAFSPLVLHTFTPSGPFGARTWAASNAGDSGWSNQIIYTSPKVADFQVNVSYQPGELSGSQSRKNYGINAFYTLGKLDLTAEYHNVQVSNPNAGTAILDVTAAPINYASINHQKSAFAGARYDFTVLKAFATYRENRDDAFGAKGMEDRTYSLGLSAPAGAGAVLVGFANTKRTGSLVGADLKRDTLSVGYDYALSKRTDLYAIYMTDKISTASRADSYVGGVRHRF